MDGPGRVLVLFGNIPMYGQERGNIEMIDALRGRGWEALFVVQAEYGHLHVTPALEAMGIPWRPARFAERADRNMSVGGWMRRLRDIALGSWDLAKIIREFRPSHIHFGSSQWFVSFLPVLLVTRIPLVMRVGDSPAKHRAAFRMLWKVIGMRVARFIANSEFIRRRLEEATGRPEKISVIQRAPAGRIGVPGTAGVAKHPDEFTFVYVGQISREKGVDLIVEVAVRLCRESSDVRFVLAGGYELENSLGAELVSRVREEGLASRIRFVGYQENVAALFAASDAHLCPSVWEEPAAGTVLEAKAAGIPSIVTPVGGLPDMVENGVDGIVCRGTSAEDLEEACRRYLGEPGAARKHGEAALVAGQRFDPSRFAREVHRVYSDI